MSIEFHNESNAYFQGNDVVADTDSGHSVKINAKDGFCAINVKDRMNGYGWIDKSVPEDVQALAEDLNSANESRMVNHEYLTDYTDLLYERARQGWWDDAEHLISDEFGSGVHGEACYQAGRSGGWCCFAALPDSEGYRIMHPEDEDDRELQERFFKLAGELLDNMDHWRENWYGMIREEHAELEREREEVIERGTD